MVERWLERWSPEEVQSLVDRHNRPPPLYLRPLRISVEEGLDRLRQDGVQAEAVEEGAGCIWVVGGGDPGALVRRVEGVVQDPAAAWVTRYAAPPAGALVADLCAAPGGKALSLAGEGAKVVAGDRSFPRLRLVQEGARRLGLPVWPVVALAEAPPVARADLVLVDVPCSGTGTLARHPDARWRLTWKDVASLVRVQDRILDGAVQAVPPRGLLVYSTCTMEVEENEERARAFLSRHPEFRPEPGSGVPERYLTREGFLRILPHETGFDGAFAARFRRVGSE